MRKITQREYAIFSFVKQFLDDYNQSPTRKEVGEAFLISAQGADYFIKKLCQRNIFSLKNKNKRNIRINKKYLARQKHLL